MNLTELFIGVTLENHLTQLRNKMVEEISKLEAKQVQETPPAELGERVAKRYQVKPLSLYDDKKYVRESGPTYAATTTNSIHLTIPYEGDAQLFRLKPNGMLKPPEPIRADVISDVITLPYSRPDFDGKALREIIERDVEIIKKNVGLANKQVQSFNEAIVETARSMLRDRQDAMLKRKQFLNELGIPVKE
ncbi:MAG TPA: hypothetical protein VD835_07720 [Pyrinomonadaceae bacterium]|nr:hypothetical protein [Pyrinomonadaceae bacterium]